MSTYRIRRRPAAALLAIALAAALAACGGSTPSQDDALARISSFQSVAASALGPAAGRVSQFDGTSWSFAHPADGKVTLLYFGYTSCPDVCPMTMSDLAGALHRLPASVRDRVWVQFVSTDPERDTARQLKWWLGTFYPGFHGGRMPIAGVIAAARSYGIAIEKPRVTKGDYTVAHGTQVVVLDQRGSAVGFFAELAGSTAYRDAIPALVEKYA